MRLVCSFESGLKCFAALRLHDVSVECSPCELLFLAVRAPAGFPSPPGDDIEEPIDLGQWLVENPATSYVMRVEGYSMSGAGIGDGDDAFPSHPPDASRPHSPRPTMWRP